MKRPEVPSVRCGNTVLTRSPRLSIIIEDTQVMVDEYIPTERLKSRLIESAKRHNLAGSIERNRPSL